jgi:hypothetical protein
MQQGGGVDELDRGGQADMALAAMAAQPGRGEGEDRTDALAARGDKITGQLRDQLDRALHPLQDQGVHRLQILGDEGGQAVERAGIGGRLRRQGLGSRRSKTGGQAWLLNIHIPISGTGLQRGSDPDRIVSP